MPVTPLDPHCSQNAKSKKQGWFGFSAGKSAKEKKKDAKKAEKQDAKDEKIKAKEKEKDWQKQFGKNVKENENVMKAEVRQINGPGRKLDTTYSTFSAK